jgi:hypothetical protein
MHHIKTSQLVLSFFLCTILLLSPITITTAKTQNDPTYTESSQGLPTIGQWPFTTAVADINHDGNLDLIRLRGHDDFNPPDQGFQIWLGDNQGTWTKTAIPSGNFGYGGTAIGDFNNDGNLDAAYACHHYNDHPMIGAWTGDGGTNFTESSTGLATDGESFGLSDCALADFTNDGSLDILAAGFGSSGIRAYINHQGGQTWTSASNGLPHADTSPLTNHWILAPDINRDEYLDIAVQERDIDGTTHFIWTGDGTGNWTPNDYGLPVEWTHGTDGLDVGDINNDGWPDITFIHHDGSNAVPVVYTFNGATWTPASTGLPTQSTYGPLAFGDLNNDGYLDLVGLEVTTGTTTAVHAWLGDGTGHWTQLPTIATGIVGGPESLTLADIDHNNKLDIIVSSESSGDYTPGGLHIFKETTPASTLAIQLRQPSGGEVFIPGAVRTITWTSSIPTGTATITLEDSLTGPNGPWYPIVDTLLDTNQYQWHIPATGTQQGYLKATIHWNSQTSTSITPRPFTIKGDNYPPDIPTLTGPTHGFPNTPYNYSAFLTDPDGNGVSVLYDWGDNTTTDWIGPVAPGTTVTQAHTWTTSGVYQVRAKAKDTNDAESPWSNPLTVTITPANISIQITPGRLTVKITNTGTTPINNLTTTLSRDGGILNRHKSNSQTIAILPPGATETTSLPLIGLGKITLQISIKANEIPEQTTTITGTLLFIFLLGVK